LDSVKDQQERTWYLQETLTHGWGRDMLVHQIETELYRRQGGAITNFEATLPALQSDLVNQVVKDPYLFGFMTLDSQARERDLERKLLEHIRDFLLELGRGFAFMGNQYQLTVGDKDYFLDLLFYHVHLRCHVVVELKIGEFKPEYAGKMNFYLSAVDDQLRHPDDQPSIGILLCKTRDRITAEYALRDINKPMGVATYRLLPDKIRDELPSLEEIEEEFSGNSEEKGDHSLRNTP
jgi:predicted nuclease of restriction endonuclease-like (RecB) superfamily